VDTRRPQGLDYLPDIPEAYLTLDNALPNIPEAIIKLDIALRDVPETFAVSTFQALRKTAENFSFQPCRCGSRYVK
jgi:hypothetical protein